MAGYLLCVGCISTAGIFKQVGDKMFDQGAAGPAGTRAVGEVGMHRYGFGLPIGEQGDEFTAFKLPPTRPGRCRCNP
ncbi:hypothetical protein D9M71_618790 [compost metagenome]